MHNINKHRSENQECTIDDKDKVQEGPEIVGEAAAGAMNDDCDGATICNLDLNERVSKLNEDQHCIFDNLSEHFVHQYRHEIDACNCKDFKPVHMFVSGVGGTGKSFLIETIRAKVAEIWKEKNGQVICAVAAPTGLAAYIINGVTVHRLFQLPIEHEGKTAGYWSLPKASQKVMRTNLCSLKLVIIDEVSMLSNLNLAYIHLHLEKVFGESPNWLGATNVLFVGDILQLPPVNSLPVFSPLHTRPLLTDWDV